MRTMSDMGAHRPPISLLILLALGSLLGGCGLFVGPQSSAPPPTASPTPSPTPGETPSLTATPTATGSPPLAVCDPATLAARITQWDGAAGHRIPPVELTSIGVVPRPLRAPAPPQPPRGPG